jgi:REP element-mobilizing transposase RayT
VALRNSKYVIKLVTSKVKIKVSMPGTFSQIYIQVVFAVKNRNSHPSWEADLYKYISGIVRNKQQKMLAINGMPDHIHFLIGMRPSCCLSDLIREIKKASNEFVHGKGFSEFKFSWQEGYGAFSYSHSALDQVIAYIINQKEHHKKQTFKDEYKLFMEKFQIEHKDEYLFDWLNNEP